MRMMPFLVIAAWIVTGCATPTLSTRAQQIIIHRDISTQLEGCKRLGPVQTDTRGGPFDFSAVADKAFRDQAIERYGDSVDNIALINRDILPAGRVVMQGIAYSYFRQQLN